MGSLTVSVTLGDGATYWSEISLDRKTDTNLETQRSTCSCTGRRYRIQYDADVAGRVRFGAATTESSAPPMFVHGHPKTALTRSSLLIGSNRLV